MKEKPIDYNYNYEGTQEQSVPFIKYVKDIERSEIGNLVINKREQEILRNLAENVLALSLRTIEKEKKELWCKHNELKATRPPIFITGPV